MKASTSRVNLPLQSPTPDTWAAAAMGDLLELLNDHAHLERKAASNALELLHRYPDPTPPENWVQVMTAVARDEVDHLATVARLLARRGGRLTKSHSNPYAKALRELIRLGEGNDELVDRLLVSALIEARSCERFEILSRCCQDRELAELYEDLWTSEHGHYRVFLNLGRDLIGADAAERRWQEMLAAEAAIIRSQSAGPRMHSWIEVSDSRAAEQTAG